MSAEEEIPESVKTTLDAMRGKEDSWTQNRIALLAVVALLSGWATLGLFGKYARRDTVSAMQYVILFPCVWGFGVFLFALVLFRTKRKEPHQSAHLTQAKGQR